MKNIVIGICVMIFCGACKSSKDLGLNSSDVIAKSEETQIFATVLSSYLKKVSTSRGVRDWSYRINLSPERIEELLATQKFSKDIKLVSSVKPPPDFHPYNFSSITIQMSGDKSRSKCEIEIDEATAVLAAQTWIYTCLKFGGRWYIVKHLLFCVS
jgi:hypothetical protein